MDGAELKTTPKAAKILAGGTGSPTVMIPEVKGPGLAERESSAQSQGRAKPGPRSVCGGGGGSSWYTPPTLFQIGSTQAVSIASPPAPLLPLQPPCASPEKAKWEVRGFRVITLMPQP